MLRSGEQRYRDGESKNIPYLPNLRRTPERSIDPKSGASVWALGNQACSQNRGVLVPKVTKRQKAKDGLKREDRSITGPK